MEDTRKWFYTETLSGYLWRGQRTNWSYGNLNKKYCTAHSIIKYFQLFQIAEKKKKLKKEGKGDEVIPEDDPDKYKHAIYVMVMKVRNTQPVHQLLFKDLEYL